MKQNQFKKVVGVFAMIAGAIVLSAFSVTGKAASNTPTEKKDVIAFSHLNPQPDSVTISILGKEVADIVFSAKKATLSHLNPMEPPADGEATIGGVKVIQTLGTLNKTDLMTIKFFMADSAFYNRGSIITTSPYAPSYALSFYKGKQRIDLLFSLQSNEMGIVNSGKLQKVIHYHNERQITRFFYLVSQNEFYKKIIEIQ